MRLFIITKYSLHLCTFKTPTLWAVMSEQGDADYAFEMRNGVKFVITTHSNSALIIQFLIVV